MLFRASRTLRAPELQWPLGRESDWGREKLAGKQEGELENREEEDGLGKRTRLFDTDEVEDVEEVQEEVEDEGLAFCVGI